VIAVVAALPGLQPHPPESGRDEAFVRPFDYQVPAGSGIRLYPKADRLHVLSAPPGDVWGISIWAVGDVLEDHCSWDPAAPVATREPGVEGLLAYIRSVDRLDVDDIGRVVVDGKPAYHVDLSVEGGESRCPDHGSIVLWNVAGGRGGPIQVPEAGHVPVTLLDVDGETIAIEIWAGGEMEQWLPTAEGIVDSIRFLYRPPVESPRSNSTRSP